MRRLTVVLGLIWAIGFGLYFAFGPVYGPTSSWMACDPEPCSPEQVAVANAPSSHVLPVNSGLAANGPILLLVLGVPVFLAAAPLFVPRAWQRSVAGIAAILTLASLISFGYFYLPSAAALAIAAVWPARRGWLVRLFNRVRMGMPPNSRST
jgi:hypothetical protein